MQPLPAGCLSPAQAPLLVVRSTVTTSTPCTENPPLAVMTSTPEQSAVESITGGNKGSKPLLSAAKGGRTSFGGSSAALSPMLAS